jgi:hypothetical protein
LPIEGIGFDVIPAPKQELESCAINSATLPRTGAWTLSRDEAIRSALKELRRGGVDIDRAPKQALELVIAANVPVEDHPANAGRRRRR